ncbi:hypothetical protein COOONC_10315 [Cooperia oncophora]
MKLLAVVVLLVSVLAASAQFGFGGMGMVVVLLVSVLAVSAQFGFGGMGMGMLPPPPPPPPMYGMGGYGGMGMGGWGRPMGGFGWGR